VGCPACIPPRGMCLALNSPPSGQGLNAPSGVITRINQIEGIAQVSRSSEPRPRPPIFQLVTGQRPDLDADQPIDVRPRTMMPRTITLLSGKGGVGKTNIAASLAIALGQAGQRVLLVDADLSLSSIDLLMGVMPRHTAADLVAGRSTLEETCIESYAGVRVLSSSSGDEDLANLDDVRRQKLFRGLNGLGESIDMILIDAGAGVGRNVTSLARLGGENLIVTTPEPPAISAAFSLLKILDRSESQKAPAVLVNQVTGSMEAHETWTRILKACKQFLNVTPDYWGWLPLDPQVARAVRAQEPFLLSHPGSPAAKSIVRLAQRVLQNSPVRDPEGVGRPVGARERLAG